MPDSSHPSAGRRLWQRLLATLALPSWVWALITGAALLVHLWFWWLASRSRMTPGLVVAFYGSRLAVTAAGLIAVSSYLWRVRDYPVVSGSHRALIWFGRLVWLVGLVALVVQLILFERSAMRLFFDRFALRLF